MRFADILASLVHDMKNSLGMVINTLEEFTGDSQADGCADDELTKPGVRYSMGALHLTDGTRLDCFAGDPWSVIPADVAVNLRVLTPQGIHHVRLHFLGGRSVAHQVVHEVALEAEAKVDAFGIAIPTRRASQHQER